MSKLMESEQTQTRHSDQHAAPKTQQQSAHTGSTAAPDVAPAPPRTAKLVVGIVLLVLLLAGGLALLNRTMEGHALARETERAAVPVVAVVHPTQEKPDEDLVLPGSLQAYEESPIYARTSGYLVKWYKDIGSRVQKGELLAKIDTPEIDQELSQTRAARQQTAAQLDLARTSAERWENLRKSDSVSQQEADQQVSAYKQGQANLAAADANVRRLEQLESFKNVYAPFSGVLTKRNVDPGALINAGAAGKELFDVARVDPLRVFVNVPQAYASTIKTGNHAWITLQEFPGKKFEGVVSHTADAIDPATRTMVAEVDVPNKNSELLPGSFGQVHFSVHAAARKVTVPVNAMLFRAEGPRVAVVGGDNKVQLRPISIGNDYGTTLEILGGVNENEQVIINPADSLEEGQQVQIASANQQGSNPSEQAGNGQGATQGGTPNQDSSRNQQSAADSAQQENRSQRTSSGGGQGGQQQNDAQQNGGRNK
jgi:multidrug efflux system membrane fusion protein